MDSLDIVRDVLEGLGFSLLEEAYGWNKISVNTGEALFDIYRIENSSQILIHWYPALIGTPPRLQVGHSMDLDLADPDSLDQLRHALCGNIDVNDSRVETDVNVDMGGF